MYDDLGAGIGSRIAISEGGEAAQPFHPECKPIDAYNAAILDDRHRRRCRKITPELGHDNVQAELAQSTSRN